MARRVVIVVALIALAGCVCEADRDNADMVYRICQGVYEDGAMPGDAKVGAAVTLSGKMTQRLGPPLTQEPLTQAAADAVATKQDEAIERDAYWAGKLDVCLGGLAGLLGLGTAYQTLKRAKEKRKFDTMVVAVDETKDIFVQMANSFSEKKKDGKIDVADVIALFMEGRDKVGPVIQHVATLKGTVADIEADYQAQKKNGG